MNILVIYDSLTHNTKRIAEAVADELSHIEESDVDPTDLHIFSISQLTDEALASEMHRADLIILGSWNKRSTFSPAVLTRVGAVLTQAPHLGTTKAWAYILTSGAVAPPYIKVCKSNLLDAFSQVTNVADIFICQGKMGEHVLRKYESGKGHSADTPEMLKLRIANWHEARNHPNEQDITAARIWARHVFETAASACHSK